MAIKGLKNYVYSILTENEDGTFSYGEVKKLPGATETKVSPASDTAELYSDDGLEETETSKGATEVEIGITDLKLQDKAELLGDKFENGIYTEYDDFNPPHIAFGFEAPKSKTGGSRLTWLTKGKPQPIEDNYKTKGEKVEFQTKSIKYKFMRRCDGVRKYEVDTDYEGAPTKEQFFTKEFLENGKVTEKASV